MASELRIKNTSWMKALLRLAAVFSMLFGLFFIFMSPQKTLSIALVFLLYAIAYTNTQWGVITLLFLLPLNKVPEVTGAANATIPELALFAVFFSWSLGKTKEESVRLGNKRVTTLLLGFAAFGFLSILIGGNFHNLSLDAVPANPTYEDAANNSTLQALMSFRELLHLFEWLIAYVMAFDVAKNLNHARSYATAIVAGIVLAAAVTLPQHVNELNGVGFEKLLDQYSEKFTVFFNSSTTTASYILLAGPLCIALIVSSERKLAKFYWSTSFAVLFISLFFTYSRSVFILFSLAVILYAIILCKMGFLKLNHRRIAISIVGIILALFLMREIYGSLEERPAVVRRFLEIPEQLQIHGDYYTASRPQMWAIALEMAKDNPQGVGLGRYPTESFKHIHNRWMPNLIQTGYLYENAHNYLLQTWVELGFAGLILFLWIIYALARDLRGSIKNITNPKANLLAYALALGLANILLHSLLDHPLLVPSISILFWFNAGTLSRGFDRGG